MHVVVSTRTDVDVFYLGGGVGVLKEPINPCRRDLPVERVLKPVFPCRLTETEMT